MLTRRLKAEGWDLAGGRVTGATHRRSGRPCQDAYTLARGRSCQVVAVADGCGSGPHSEVGAELGVRLWVHEVIRRLDGGRAPEAPETWEDVADAVVGRLESLALGLGPNLPRVVSECLLFTVVGAVATEASVVTFAIGDGLVWIDGTAMELGPFPGDAPPYLAYGLLPERRRPEVILPHVLEATEVSSLVVGTDGLVELGTLCHEPVPGREGERVGGPEQFVADPFFRNPDQLRRRLSVLNRERTEIDWEEELWTRSYGPIQDDVAVVAMRRRPG